MTHLSNEQLQEYVDGAVQDPGKRIIESHVGSCHECAGRLNNLKHIDSILMNIPPDRIAADFTHQVMKKIIGRSARSIAWTVFQYAAPVAGLFTVLMSTIILLKYFGGTGETQNFSLWKEIHVLYQAAGSGTAEALNGMGWWLKTKFQTGIGTGEAVIVQFALFMILFAVLLEKTVIVPFFRRKIRD